VNQITVNGPNGVTINFPEGTDAATIESVMSQALGASKPAAPEKGWLETIGGMANAAVRGAADVATLGTMDKIAAGLGSLTGIGGTRGDYAGNLAAQRGADKQAGEEYPVSNIVGSVAGGVALPVARLAKGAGLGAQSLNAAVTGAGIGGAYSVGKQLDGVAPSDFAKVDPSQAATGALVGGAIGAVAPSAIAGIQKAYGAGATQFNRVFAPRDLAESKVAAALSRDKMTPADVTARLSASTPEATVADVAGENTRRLLKLGAQTPGSGREMAVKVLDERAGGQPQRMLTGVADDLADGGVYYQKLDKITADLKTKASPVYDKAYATPLSGKAQLDLEAITPRIPASAINRANQLMKVEGVKSQQILATVADDGTVAFSRPPDVRQWDYIGRGINELIDGADGKGATGGTNQMGRALGGLKRQIDEVLESGAPALGEARRIFAGDIVLKKAIEKGRLWARGDAEATQRELAKMSSSEREMFKIGMARQLMEDIRSAPDGAGKALISKVWNEAKRQKIHSLFGADSINKFTRLLDNELQFIKTRRTALGGSETFSNLAEGADSGGGATLLSGAADLISGNVRTGLSKIGQAGFVRPVTGMNENVSDRVVQLLLSGNGDDLAKALAPRQMKIEASNARRGFLTDQLTRGGVIETERQRLPAR
jgi:hypothetical protein